MRTQIFKTIAILMTIVVWILSVGAERNEPLQNDGHINFEAAGFEKISVTAYCVGHHTANGDAVYEGGCACSPDHIGDVAILYTLDGEFLGYFYCNDTGAKDGGVRAGKVIDVYRSDYDRCVEFMKLLGKEQKCYVMWVHGEG